MKIDLLNVSKNFKNITIISDVNMKLKKGKIYGFAGRNGTGKSVLLKLICGFYLPSSGSILFDGINYNEKNEFPPNLRALIEKPNFFPDLTGFDNLKLLAQIQNKISDDEILNALEIVNLQDEKDKKYNKYSLGMKQKLGIAQAIMENPDILILDEPFNGIEQSTVEKLIDYLNGIKKSKIIIISTHIRDDLDKLADVVFKFDGGSVVEEKND